MECQRCDAACRAQRKTARSRCCRRSGGGLRVASLISQTKASFNPSGFNATSHGDIRNTNELIQNSDSDHQMWLFSSNRACSVLQAKRRRKTGKYDNIISRNDSSSLNCNKKLSWTCSSFDLIAPQDQDGSDNWIYST